MQTETTEKWQAGHDGDPCQIGTTDGQFVAMTLPCDATVADAKDYARAQLIAAAPDMLAALKAVSESYCEHDLEPGGHIDAEAILAVRAAIARVMP